MRAGSSSLFFLLPRQRGYGCTAVVCDDHCELVRIRGLFELVYGSATGSLPVPLIIQERQVPTLAKRSEVGLQLQRP